MKVLDKLDLLSADFRSFKWKVDNSKSDATIEERFRIAKALRILANSLEIFPFPPQYDEKRKS